MAAETADNDSLWRAILELPPRQRACLVLRYYEDLRYRTVDGTAIAGKDYLERHTSVTFPPGTVYPHFAVPMIGDTKVEPDETFRARIRSTTNSTYTDHSVTATILNDD